jgi:hypothetical protein
VFTRVAACILALPPIRDTLIEGFSHFVTSMTAPIASDWSGFAGWGLHRLESAAFARRTPITDVAHIGWVGQTLQSSFVGFTFTMPSGSRKHPHRFGSANSLTTVEPLARFGQKWKR